jgi:hypothetical protein
MGRKSTAKEYQLLSTAEENHIYTHEEESKIIEMIKNGAKPAEIRTTLFPQLKTTAVTAKVSRMKKKMGAAEGFTVNDIAEAVGTSMGTKRRGKSDHEDSEDDDDDMEDFIDDRFSSKRQKVKPMEPFPDRNPRQHSYQDDPLEITRPIPEFHRPAPLTTPLPSSKDPIDSSEDCISAGFQIFSLGNRRLYIIRKRMANVRCKYVLSSDGMGLTWEETWSAREELYIISSLIDVREEFLSEHLKDQKKVYDLPVPKKLAGGAKVHSREKDSMRIISFAFAGTEPEEISGNLD